MGCHKIGRQDLTGLDMSSSLNTTAFECDQYCMASVIISWTGATGKLNGTVKAQWSHDNSVWVDFVNGHMEAVDPIDINAASGEKLIWFEHLPATYTRVVYTANNISGGAMRVYTVGKDG